MSTMDREWVVHPNGDALVALVDLPDLLTEFFDLEPGEVKPGTVYVWWDRSKRNVDIRVPMPEPVRKVGGSYVWTQESILHWFGAYRGLPVPECTEAGDRLAYRGRYTPSKWRAVWA